MREEEANLRQSQMKQESLLMIQVTITYECPRCGSVDMVRNGHDYKGSQKYHCKACGSYGTLHGQRGYDNQRHEQVERALLERVSLRGIARIFQMSRKTVARWLHRLLEHLPPTLARVWILRTGAMCLS
jgi:transposase-like protein